MYYEHIIKTITYIIHITSYEEFLNDLQKSAKNLEFTAFYFEKVFHKEKRKELFLSQKKLYSKNTSFSCSFKATNWQSMWIKFQKVFIKLFLPQWVVIGEMRQILMNGCNKTWYGKQTVLQITSNICKFHTIKMSKLCYLLKDILMITYGTKFWEIFFNVL